MYSFFSEIFLFFNFSFKICLIFRRNAVWIKTENKYFQSCSPSSRQGDYSVFPLLPAGCQTVCKMISGWTNWFCPFAAEISEPSVNQTLEGCRELTAGQPLFTKYYIKSVEQNFTFALCHTAHDEPHLFPQGVKQQLKYECLFQWSPSLVFGDHWLTKIRDEGCSSVGGNVSLTMPRILFTYNLADWSENGDKTAAGLIQVASSSQCLYLKIQSLLLVIKECPINVDDSTLPILGNVFISDYGNILFYLWLFNNRLMKTFLVNAFWRSSYISHFKEMKGGFFSL